MGVMDMDQHVFKVQLQPDYTCKIELGGYEQLAALDELAKMAAIHDKMAKWLDDPNVPMAQKESFQQTFQNLLHTISFVWDLLKKAGVTEDELKEHMKIPF